MVAVTWLRLHPVLVSGKEITTVRMPGYPWTAIVCLILLGGLVLLMLSDAASQFAGDIGGYGVWVCVPHEFCGETFPSEYPKP